MKKLIVAALLLGSSAVAPFANATILGNINIQPNPLVFPDTRVGQTSSVATETATKFPAFTLPVFIFGSFLTNPFRFDITDDRCAGETLFTGDTCGIDTTFSPNRPGFYHSHLVVIDTGRQIANFSLLLGKGVFPKVQLSDTSIAFGDQPIDAVSADHVITLTNVGTGDLTVSSVDLSGDPVFNIVSETCTAAPIPAKGTCLLTFNFQPTAVQSYSGTVSITDDASDSPQQISLAGNGVAAGPPALCLSTENDDFGNQDVGVASPSRDVTVTNCGSLGSQLNITGIASSNPDFTLSGTCVPSITLADGASCNLTLTFTPVATGPTTGNVSFTTLEPVNPPTIDVSGIGIQAGTAEVTLSANSLEFGNITVGNNSNSQTVTVTNTGTAPLTFTGIALAGANPHAYGMVDECSDDIVQPGESCLIEVIFSPQENGDLPASITLTDDADGSPQTITLNGTGTGGATPELRGSRCSIAGAGMVSEWSWLLAGLVGLLGLRRRK